jgi:hypothetical protein
MDGADARTAKHGDGGFGHHRHIDDDPVAFAHAIGGQNTGEFRHLVLKLFVGVFPDGIPGDGGIINQGHLVGAAFFDVAINGVVAGVDLGAHEPPVKGLVGIVQDLVPFLDPVDILGDFAPKPFGIVH